jgi:hypothetical protein
VLRISAKSALAILDAGARADVDEAFGLQRQERVAHRPERHVEQRHQLRLRHEGAGLDPALEQRRLEALVGELAQAAMAAGRLGLIRPAAPRMTLA